MTLRGPVEVTTRYATTVNELADAWAFVMTHLDRVGDAPTVKIGPVWSSEDEFRRCYFEVVVSGMVEQSPAVLRAVTEEPT